MPTKHEPLVKDLVTNKPTAAQNSSYGTQMQLNNASIIPGGRLTTTSENPFNLVDQTGKTTIYYTPFINNIIPLWNGTSWEPIEFSALDAAENELDYAIKEAE